MRRLRAGALMLGMALACQAAAASRVMLRLSAGGAYLDNGDASRAADLSPLGFAKNQAAGPAAYPTGGVGLGYFAANGFFQELGWDLEPQRDFESLQRKNGVLVSKFNSKWNSSALYFLAGYGLATPASLDFFFCLKFSAEIFSGTQQEWNYLQSAASSYTMSAAGYGFSPLLRADWRLTSRLSLGLESGYNFVSMGNIATTGMNGAYSGLQYSFNKNPDGSVLKPELSGPFFKASLAWSWAGKPE